MRYFSKMFSFWRGNTTGQRSGSQDITPIAIAHEDVPAVSIDTSLQISTVWACVKILVDNIASLPLVVHRSVNDQERQVAKDDRLYTVLHDRPNRRQTSFEFWSFIILNLVLRGNGYARIDRDQQGEVMSLWPLATDQMEVIISEDGSLLYIYSFDNHRIVYNEEQIFHIKGMGNGVVGMSVLEYMGSSVGVAISAQNHISRTFRKDGRRPGILMSDTVLNDAQRAAVKKNFGDIATGTGKELYVLEAQFKFEPLGMSPADLQLLETKRFSVQDIARWFGVPSVLINDTGEASSLGSSTQEVVAGFYKLTLRPILTCIEQVIQQRILTPKQRAQGLVAEFNLDALLRTSLIDRMEIYAKGSQNGLYTRNECRKRENLPAMEGGDVLTAQVNLVPLDMLGQQNKGGAVPPEPIGQ